MVHLSEIMREKNNTFLIKPNRKRSYRNSFSKAFWDLSQLEIIKRVVMSKKPV